MPDGCRGALYGLLIGIIVSIIIVLVWRPDAGDPYFPPIGEGQARWAYTSFQLYAEKNLNIQRDMFQPYEVGVATYEGDYVWHFRFALRSSNQAAIFDWRFRSKANNVWEQIKP